MAKIVFRDRNPDVIRELYSAFPGWAADVMDIFGAPCSGVISPANSFGWMDGGIDAVYLARWPSAAPTLKAKVAALPFRELLVGQALLVETGDTACPHLIAAPTMRAPGATTFMSVFLAARAAFFVSLSLPGVVASPGLGTGTGHLHPKDAARAMRLGYEEAVAFAAAAKTAQNTPPIDMGG